MGDGESYRGNVSETDDDHECLYWNSHFILEHGSNPFNSFEDKDGLGPHNFCRSEENSRVCLNQHLPTDDLFKFFIYNVGIQTENQNPGVSSEKVDDCFGITVM